MTDYYDLVTGFVNVNIGLILRPVIVHRVDWDDTADVQHAPFGFAIPAFEPGDPDLSVQVCPELIAEQVATLDDDEVMTYLLHLEFHISQHVIHFGTMGDDEIEAHIQTVMQGTAPAMYRASQEIQMHALGM